MMQANRKLRNFEATLAAIEHSHSAFERYHAMLLTTLMIDDLDAMQLRRLADIIKSQRGVRFRRDTDRWQLSEEILKRVDGRSGTR